MWRTPDGSAAAAGAARSVPAVRCATRPSVRPRRYLPVPQLRVPVGQRLQVTGRVRQPLQRPGHAVQRVTEHQQVGYPGARVGAEERLQLCGGDGIWHGQGVGWPAAAALGQVVVGPSSRPSNTSPRKPGAAVVSGGHATLPQRDRPCMALCWPRSPAAPRRRPDASAPQDPATVRGHTDAGACGDRRAIATARLRSPSAGRTYRGLYLYHARSAGVPPGNPRLSQ